MLNLADNAIASIDAPTAEAFKALRQLALAGNPIVSLSSIDALALEAPALERLSISTDQLDAGPRTPRRTPLTGQATSQPRVSSSPRVSRRCESSTARRCAYARRPPLIPQITPAARRDADLLRQRRLDEASGALVASTLG